MNDVLTFTTLPVSWSIDKCAQIRNFHAVHKVLSIYTFVLQEAKHPVILVFNSHAYTICFFYIFMLNISGSCVIRFLFTFSHFIINAGWASKIRNWSESVLDYLLLRALCYFGFKIKCKQSDIAHPYPFVLPNHMLCWVHTPYQCI